MGGAEPTTIGRYELSSKLGSGGFANVHRAHDAALDADVAIKVLQPQFVDNADIRQRFLQEARLLRRVDSTHLVKVYDIGEMDDGRPYFVMELADGGVLSTRVAGRRNNIDRNTIAAVVDALVEGLGALHKADIVHRDVKPDNLLISGSNKSNATQLGNSLLAEGERFLIGDLGLAKDQSQTSAGPTVAGGTPFYRAPEQMTAGSTITPAADIYAATGVLWFLISGGHPPETAAIPAQLTSMPAAWQPVLERGLQRDPTLRHGSIAEWANQARKAIEASPETGLATVEIGDASELCPYKGMAAFQPEDAGLFFGRDDMVDSLVGRIQNHPVLVIGGPSGSGKSSLLRAGLIPKLGRGAIAGSQQWRIALFNPGSDAVGELVHQLRRLRPDSNEQLTRQDLPQGGRRWLDDGTPTLLAIDQFEELFTLNTYRAEQELFLETLAVMTESAHSRIRVAIALRADFYGVCASFPWLSDRINESQLLVGPMSRQELRDAISIPAQRAGLHMEEGLTDTILDDVGPGGGALPLLGHALMETWIRRRGSQLTLEGYEAAGGVSGAIAQRAEDIFNQLSEPEQATARHLLLQLINPGQGTPDTRRRVRRQTLRTDESLLDVMEKLAAARLLTVDDEAVEVAHEALLLSWPRLRAWIDEDRENLQTRRRIGASATEWETAEKNPDLLYRGTQLAAAMEWMEQHPDELDPAATDFLLAGAKVRDEAEQEQAEAEAKARRGRRLAVGALAILAVAAVAASLVALGALRRSQMNERAAETRQVQVLAEAAGANASEQPLLATALALESLRQADPPLATARDSLVEARVGLDQNRWLPQPFGRPVTVGDMLAATITPDAEMFITGGRSGEVIFWNRNTRTKLFQFDAVHDLGVNDLEISPDGRWMMSSGGTQLVLWDLAAAEPEPILFHQIDGRATPIWDLAFSADGSRVAVASELAGIIAFDRESRQVLSTTLEDDRFDFLSVAFIDNQRVAAGDGRGNLWMVDVDNGEVLGDETTASEGGFDIWEVVYNPSSETIITASSDNTIQTWIVEPENYTLASVMEQEGIRRTQAVSLARDNTELVFGEAQGRLVRLDPETGELIPDGTSVKVHDDEVIDTAASENGWLISLGEDQQLGLWRYLGDLGPVDEIIAEVGSGTDLALSASAERLVVATESGPMVLDAMTGELLSELEGGSQSVAFVGDEHVIAGSENGLIRRWDVSTGQQLQENAGHAGSPIRTMAVSPNQEWVVSGGDDGSVIMWSADTLDLERELAGHGQNQVTDVIFSPDGETVISVGFDGALRLSPINGDDAVVINISQDGPQTVAVHPDGSRLAVGGSAERVDIIDLDGNAISTVAPHPGGVWDVAFTPDGLSIAATARGSDLVSANLKLWDWESEEPLGPAFPVRAPEPGTELVKRPHVVIGPDLTVWSAGSDGKVRRLDVLNQQVGCSLITGLMDAKLQERFLGGEEPLSCR